MDKNALSGIIVPISAPTVHVFQRYDHYDRIKGAPSHLQDQLAHLSLDYLLAGMVKHYCLQNEDKHEADQGRKRHVRADRYRPGEHYWHEPAIQTVRQFNDNNKLSHRTMLYYGFFAVASHQYSKALFPLLGPFQVSPFGAMSRSMKKKLDDSVIGPPQKNPNSFFAINPKKENRLHILADSREDTLQTLAAIQRSLRENIVSFDVRGQLPFEEIYIESDKGEHVALPTAIDAGIAAINVRSQGALFSADGLKLMENAKRFGAIHKAHATFGQPLLSYEDIAPDIKRGPFYAPHTVPRVA